MRYLTVDVGSTFTKLNLIDLEKLELIGSSASYTTVEKDVMIGFENALELLSQKCDVKYDEMLGCSSAAGGLKIVAIGFSETLTTKASKIASLNCGARVIRTFSYEMDDGDLDELQKANPDIIVLSGGTDGGNERNIIHNANVLSKLQKDIPVVICGNKYASEKVEKILTDKKIRTAITENIMPNTNVVNYKPLRKLIGEIFISNIVYAKGINKLSQGLGIFIPTPVSVQYAVSTFAKFDKSYSMSIDIGGATTDVFSVSKSYLGNENIIPPIMDEPYEKRSVEGDAGMRYSAMSLYESAGQGTFDEYGIKDAKQKCEKRQEHTDYIPDTDEEREFDKVLAIVASKTALSRHIGRLKKEPTKTRYIYRQTGKDLTEVKYIIATGGVLVNNSFTKDILEQSRLTDELALYPKNPTFLVDKSYILSASGLISKVDEEKAYKFMKKYLKAI